MSTKVYVGNLPYRTTEDDLRKLFEKYKPIHSLILISDKNTDQSRGYGFVELDESNANDALYDLRGTDFNGRNLRISVATGKKPKNKASKKFFLNKNAFVEKIPEKREKNKCATMTPTATLPHNAQKTSDYVMVAETNNYG